MWLGPDEQGRLAPALVKLYRQVNLLVPGRAASSDGSIGDTSHQTRHSDHNPNAQHVVTAIDLTHDPRGGFDSYAFARMLAAKNDNRINYLISNGEWWESGSKEGWKPYHGSNPHNHHCHISVEQNPQRYLADQDWDLSSFTSQSDATKPSVLPRLHLTSFGAAVIALQSALKIPADGDFGKETDKAVRAFQKSAGLVVDGWVGPSTWSALGITTLNAIAAGRVNEHIIATVFGGSNDPNYSAYNAAHFISDTELGCALPQRFPGNRPLLWIKGEASGVRISDVPIVDVGPIYPAATRGPADPYWETGSRPRAETSHILSQAGIDLTPLLAKRLGIDRKGLVTWGFMEAKSTMSDTSTPIPPLTPMPQAPIPPPEPGDTLGVSALKAGVAVLAPWLRGRFSPNGNLTPFPGSVLFDAVAPYVLPLLINKLRGTNKILDAVIATIPVTAVTKPDGTRAGLVDMTKLDRLLGGEALMGLKTGIGLSGTILALGLQLTGAIPSILSGDPTAVIATLAPFAYGVLGIVAKIGRKPA